MLLAHALSVATYIVLRRIVNNDCQIIPRGSNSNIDSSIGFPSLWRTKLVLGICHVTPRPKQWRNSCIPW